MKKIKLFSQKGITEVVVLAVMGVLAIVLPVVTKLVQQNQENRSQAVVSASDCKTVSDRGKRACDSSIRSCVCFVYTDSAGKVTDAHWTCVNCLSGERCTGGVCKAVISPTSKPTSKPTSTPKKCNPGEKSCSGGKVSTCNSSGTAFENPLTCVTGACKADGKSCSTVQMLGENCASSYSQCSGNNVAWYCSSGKIVKKDCAASNQDCSGGKCVAKQVVCNTGDLRCTNDVLEECNASRTGFRTKKDCGSIGCNSTLKNCNPGCNPKVAGYICEGGILKVCGSSTGAWVTVKRCADDEICDVNQKTCIPKGKPTSTPSIDSTKSCIYGGKEYKHGNARCSGSYSFICKDSVWTNGGDCPYGCDVSSGKCNQTGLMCNTVSVVGFNIYTGRSACGNRSDNIDVLYTCRLENNKAVLTAKKCTSGCDKSANVCFSQSIRCDKDSMCEILSGYYCDLATNTCKLGCKSSGKVSIAFMSFNNTKSCGLKDYSGVSNNDKYLYTCELKNSKAELTSKKCDYGCTGTYPNAKCKSSSSGGGGGYDGYEWTPEPGVEYTVTLNPDEMQLNVGQTGVVSATISPEPSEDQVCTWESSDEEIATVSGDGLKAVVNAVKDGGVVISVSCTPSGATGSMNVTVGSGEIKSIKLVPNPLNLKVGETGKIEVETEPPGLTAKYKFESEDKEIAEVFEDGTVKGIKEGEVKVNGWVEENVEMKSSTTVKVSNLGGDTSAAKVSFKLSFRGISPGARCLSAFLTNKLELDIANVPSNVHGETIPASFKETNEEVEESRNGVSVKYRVFEVDGLSIDEKFGTSNTFNFIKVKGPAHLKRRMCQDGQDQRIPETTKCEIDLRASSTKVYDFSKYYLLTGDVNVDGVINSLDLSSIKARIKPGVDVGCGGEGVEGDLNLDGYINTLDINLAKDSLLERDDE